MARKHKQKSKTNPTTALLSFPPDIIREILLKASVKSLLRCKSVCKEWYNLISSQRFIKTHYTLSSSTNNSINYKHHTLIYNTYTVWFDGSVTQDNDLVICPLYDVLFDGSVNNNALLLENPLLQSVRIVGSCNGLMCLLGVDDYTLFIYNPSTRTTNVLPRPKLGGTAELYGFGYDETTHDYKVVKIWCSNQNLRYWGAMIYSLKAVSWKQIGGFPCVGPLNDAKFLNGALHWVTGDGWSDSQDIVSLDLGKETYGEVLQPEYDDDDGYKKLTLGVLGESLCVLCDNIKSHFDVWVMKVYGMKDSWTKLVSISHPNDRNLMIPSYMDVHAPLSISNDGKLLLQIGTKLVVYDCINSSYSEIQNLDGFAGACILVESLISPVAPFGLGDDNGDEN